ncbi:MAG: hypothetical protein KGL39_08950 [Patescibacteria group bacterium]|nr:hypothetical protein [Patescibacteria group bacterium]
MGRSATVGSFAGKLIAPLSAANHDTGVILSVFPIISATIGGVTSTGVTGDLVPGYKSVLFQLVPGNMSVGSVTVYGTIEELTAAGLAQNWEPLVSPQTEANFAWSNPLTATAGQRLLKTDAPFIAYRATTDGTFNGTTTKLYVFAAP